MRYMAAALACVLTVSLASCTVAAQVLTNGDFEGGSAGGVPNGWTLVPSTVYVHDSYTANWQLFATTLNNYPTLDAYAGDYSLGAYRVDGLQHNTARPGLDFYEFNVLYQNIPVSPNTTYYVKASAAVFTHHDRMGDTEDFWGAGLELRLCPGSGQYADGTAQWRHAFWNWEGDGFWLYYPELKNQISDGAPNRFTTGSSQTSVTFSIIWYTKWNADIDISAIDDVQLELNTAGPEPPGSDDFVAKTPANWSNPDPIWSPVEKPVRWCKPGATNGGDQFYQSTECTAGMRPVNSATADFNSDGLPDIAVANNWNHLVSVYLQRPDGGFEPGLFLTGAVMPRCVQAGQVVGSPAVDLVVSSAGTHEVLVFPGNGDGTFGSPFRTPTALQPTWVAVSDFNLDNKMDFAVGEQKAGSDGQVDIYLGDAAGGFAISQTLPGISVPSFIIAEDLGGSFPVFLPDGKPDLAVLSWNGPVDIYVGAGNGTFDYYWTIDNQWQWKSTGMVSANLDEDPDSIPDLCIAYMWEADYAQIATGYGDCTFEGQSKEEWLRPGRFPSGVGALDFNKDGHPDLAFSNFESANAVVYRNLGYDMYYNFTYYDHFGVGNTNTNLIVEDVNLDGYDDMVVTGGGCQTVNVIYGAPNGGIYAPISRHKIDANAAAIANFVESTPRPEIAVASDTLRLYRNVSGNWLESYTKALYANCVDVGTADFNSDGHADLVTTCTTATGSSFAYVFFGTGTGSFTGGIIAYRTSGAKQTQDMVVADFDNTSGLDLAASEAERYYEGIYCRLNNGSGGFGGSTTDQKKSALPLDSKPRDLAAADFNSDGKADVVVALAGQNKFALMTGKGDGFFNSPVTFSAGAEPTGICAADFNSDGKPDVAVTNKADGTLMIFLGTGAGSFSSAGTVTVGSESSHVEVYDFNADGVGDLVVANPSDSTFTFLRGKGDGSFDPPQHYRTTAPPNRFAAGDLRGIGLPDLFTGTEFEIFRNALLAGTDVTVTDDGAVQSSTTSISGGWEALPPGGRSIVRYRWAVSTTPDATGIIPGGGWAYTTSTSGTRNVSLTTGQTYYILAQAEDSINLWTRVGASDGILVAAPVNVGTASEAKLQADGQPVVLSGAIVSRAWSGEPWVCYVQDPDRASGIRVEGTGAAPPAGARVNVTGVMGSSGPERMIAASDVAITDTPGEPLPLGVNDRALGGAEFEYDPGPPPSGQMGVAGGIGTSNVGLLVRTVGLVTRSETAEDFFYIDDGAGVSDGGSVGVRCMAAGLSKPAVGTCVVVTGPSGVVEVGGQPVRCVRVQRQGDIVPVP